MSALVCHMSFFLLFFFYKTVKLFLLRVLVGKASFVKISSKPKLPYQSHLSKHTSEHLKKIVKILETMLQSSKNAQNLYKFVKLAFKIIFFKVRLRPNLLFFSKFWDHIFKTVLFSLFFKCFLRKSQGWKKKYWKPITSVKPV